MIKSGLKLLYIKSIEDVTASCYNLYRSDVSFLMSFNGETDLIQKVATSLPKEQKLFVFYTQSASASATKLKKLGIKIYRIANTPWFIFHTIPKMMTSKYIFCDNYFPFLAGFEIPHQVKVIQFWHADGAIKKFGWGDAKTSQRSKSAQKRFQTVYDTFDDFIVPSKTMGQIFKQDYHLKHAHILPLGNPRIDKLYHHDWYLKTRNKIYSKYPNLKQKRVILYAPTYRRNVTLKLPHNLKNALTCQRNTVAIVKFHPAFSPRQVNYLQKCLQSPNIIFCPEFSTTELLTITNTLITDYSSVIFDYSVLPNAHSLILFWFDVSKYEQSPGLQNKFLHNLPVKPIHDLRQLVEEIKIHRKISFTKFNKVWNTYNNGYSIQRIIKHYFKNE